MLWYETYSSSWFSKNKLSWSQFHNKLAINTIYWHFNYKCVFEMDPWGHGNAKSITFWHLIWPQANYEVFLTNYICYIYGCSCYHTTGNEIQQSLNSAIFSLKVFWKFARRAHLPISTRKVFLAQICLAESHFLNFTLRRDASRGDGLSLLWRYVWSDK